jgi:hypothetical protein
VVAATLHATAIALMAQRPVAMLPG